MIYPIAAILVLYLLVSRTDALPRLAFRMSPGLFEKSTSVGAVILAIVVLIHGNVWAALVLFGLGLWLLGRSARLAPKTRRDAAVSRHRSATVEMQYDRRAGALSGRVISGPFAGRPLGTLDRVQCYQLYRAAEIGDPEGARLLEPYLDRRFTGWRGASDGDPDAGPQGAAAPGGMSEDEAYQVLGLQRGASRDEVVRSHRAVMKKWHPDQGGTAALAARANEAKEVLLRRHSSNS